MTTVESVAPALERLRVSACPPASEKYQAFGGCGSGRVCARCGAVIAKNRMEIAVVYGPGSGTNSFVLHVMCFAAWLGTAGGGEI